jgi:hypothetical protein
MGGAAGIWRVLRARRPGRERERRGRGGERERERVERGEE